MDSVFTYSGRRWRFNQNYEGRFSSVLALEIYNLASCKNYAEQHLSRLKSLIDAGIIELSEVATIFLQCVPSTYTFPPTYGNGHKRQYELVVRGGKQKYSVYMDMRFESDGPIKEMIAGRAFYGVSDYSIESAFASCKTLAAKFSGDGLKVEILPTASEEAALAAIKSIKW